MYKGPTGEQGAGKSEIVHDVYRGNLVNPRKEGIPMKKGAGSGAKKGGGTKNQYGASRKIC